MPEEIQEDDFIVRLRKCLIWSILAILGFAKASPASCPADILHIPSQLNTKLSDQEDVKRLPISIEADAIHINEDLIDARGEVEIIQGPRGIYAEQAVYDDLSRSLSVEDNIRLYTANGDKFQASHLRLNVDEFTGRLLKPKFIIVDRASENVSEYKTLTESTARTISLRGESAQLNLLSEEIFQFESVRITSCHRDQDDLYLHAKKMTLDYEEGFGIGKGLSIRFFKLPIFYFPVVKFPITEKRLSGFLAPEFGNNSSSGFSLTTPYYWNLAANYDLLLTPTYFTRRGLLAATTVRYLTDTSRGKINLQLLPGDRVRNDDRGSVQIEHEQKFNADADLSVSLHQVSDEEYLNDFSAEPEKKTITHLPELIRYRQRSGNFQFRADLLAYQTLDTSISDASKPYRQLPNLVVKASPRPDQWEHYKFDLHARYTQFAHPLRATGHRLVLRPQISRSLEASYGYLRPKLVLHHISYDIDTEFRADYLDNSATVPEFTLDSGIYFDRYFALSNNRYQHSLIPRMQYTQIGFVDQTGLPNFDSSAVALNRFNNLFRSNRFWGEDRVGDTEQLVFSVSNLINHHEGNRSIFRLDLGQIFYLADRDLVLSGNPETTSRSDYLAELSWNITRNLSISSFTRWDWQENESQENRSNLNYQNKNINLSYEYSAKGNSIRQGSLAFGWNIADDWKLSLRNRYDFLMKQPLDTLTSLTYDACCWAVTFSNERRVNQNSEYSNTFFFILELTNLGQIRGALLNSE